jgi:large subunit ribosomal protein L19
MNELIESVERRHLRQLPDFRVGDRVRVHFQVIEGTRRRTQVFEGIVLKIQGPGARRTFTVRKLSFGVGVERTFPVHSPKIERIEVMARGEVRRAKLYYLRGRIGRRARVRESRDFRPDEVAVVQPESIPEPAADGAAVEAEGAAEVEAEGEAVEAEAEVAADEEAPAADEAEEVAETEPAKSEAEGESEVEAAASGGEDATSAGDGETDGAEDSDSEEPAEGKQEGQPA